MIWKGPNRPGTLLTCIINYHRSYLPTLGTFRYPQGSQNGPHLNFGQLGSVLGQMDPFGPPVRPYKVPGWVNMTYNYVLYM